MIRYLLFDEWASTTCPKWWNKISYEATDYEATDLNSHLRTKFGNAVSFVVDPPLDGNNIYGDRYLEFENEEAMTAFFLAVELE